MIFQVFYDFFMNYAIKRRCPVHIDINYMNNKVLFYWCYKDAYRHCSVKHCSVKGEICNSLDSFVSFIEEVKQLCERSSVKMTVSVIIRRSYAEKIDEIKKLQKDNDSFKSYSVDHIPDAKIMSLDDYLSSKRNSKIDFSESEQLSNEFGMENDCKNDPYTQWVSELKRVIEKEN